MTMPTSSQSLSVLLQIEDDVELISFTCQSTGLMIWPLIRIQVLRVIMSKWLFSSIPISFGMSKINFTNLAKAGAISAIHNFGYKPDPHRNILIQSTGTGNYLHHGVIHDRLVGYFAAALREQSVVYQDKPKSDFRQKYSLSPIVHKTPRNLVNKIISRLKSSNSHHSLAQKVINRAAENASSKFGYNFTTDELESLCAALVEKLAVLPYASDTYANWFSKHAFKLLLKEDACYGGSAISVIHAARLCGMVVAEYQHGVISKGHDAYNVADALAAFHPFKAVLPDFLLTYGDWWSSQSNMPVQKISIGNPHLTETLKSLGPTNHNRKQVLILGDGIETSLYLSLARDVLDVVHNQGMSVVFRPHPLEREKVNSLMLPDGVQLDSNPDIYRSLKETSVVISELSTGLFEAIGLVDKVLLWSTKKSRFAFPEIPFPSFSSVDELRLALSDQNCDQNIKLTSLESQLWQPNWKQNYLRFVAGVVSE